MDRKEEYNIIAEKVVGHFQNNTTDQTKDIWTIPTSDYTDKDRWKKEIDEIFLKLPLMLSLAIEIPNPGDYKALEIVSMPVLITRDKESKVHAFRNVCSHRGALLTKEEIGNKNNFTCPYHGWTYSNKGNLIGITDHEKFGNLDKSCIGLQELPCQELGGMIFVILTPNLDLNLDEFLGGMKSEIEHFDFRNWYYHGFKVIHGANWKVAFDGYLEGYHFSTAHKDTILDMTMQDIMDFSAFGPHLRIAFASTNIGELLDLPKKEWWTREGQGVDFVRTLFPNVSMALGLGIGQIAQIFPGKTPETNTTVLHYLAPEVPKNKEEIAELDNYMNFLRDVVNDEDYALGLEIQKGLDSHSKNEVIFGKNEKGNQFFHKYVDYLIYDKIKKPPVL